MYISIFIIASLVMFFIFTFFKWILPALDSRTHLKDYKDFNNTIESLIFKFKSNPETIRWESSSFEIRSSSMPTGFENIDNRSYYCTVSINYTDDSKVLIKGHLGSFEKAEYKNQKWENRSYAIISDLNSWPTLIKAHEIFESVEKEYFLKPKKLEENRIKEFEKKIRISKYDEFSPTPEQRLLVKNVVDDLNLLFPAILNINYSSDFQNILNQAKEIFKGSNISVKLPENDNERFSFFEDPEIFFYSLKNNYWKAWIIMEKESITGSIILKLRGYDELNGLNMFGFVHRDGEYSMSIIDEDSNGPMVWYLRTECIKNNLSFLVNTDKNSKN